MNIWMDRTRTTPMVNFQEGHLHIEGRSIPVVDPGFYLTLVNILTEYSKNPAPVTTVEVDLECINAYSKRSMMQLFMILDTMHLEGKKIVVNWFYPSEDDAMLELGVIYQSLVSVPINFVEK